MVKINESVSETGKGNDWHDMNKNDCFV